MFGTLLQRFGKAPPSRFADGAGLVEFLSERGGQYPGDLMSAEERDVADQAADDGRVKRIDGSWGDTDYYCLVTR